MNETKEKINLFDLICRPGGVDIREAMEKTGLSYRQVELEARELISRGVQLHATITAGSLHHLLLSPQNRHYHNLINH